MHRLQRRGEARAGTQSNGAVPLPASDVRVSPLASLRRTSPRLRNARLRTAVEKLVFAVARVFFIRSRSRREHVDAASQHEIHPGFVRVARRGRPSRSPPAPARRTRPCGARGVASRARVEIVAEMVVVAADATGFVVVVVVVVVVIERREEPGVFHHGRHDDVSRSDARGVAVDESSVAVQIRENAPLGRENRPGERVAPERAGEDGASFPFGAFGAALFPPDPGQLGLLPPPRPRLAPLSEETPRNGEQRRRALGGRLGVRGAFRRRRPRGVHVRGGAVGGKLDHGIPTRCPPARGGA